MTPGTKAWLEKPAMRTAWLLTLALVTWQLLSPNPYGDGLPVNDKLVHALLFALLGYSGLAVWPGDRVALLVSGLAVYGLLVELIQHHVPGRSLEFIDWIADLLGLALALLCWRLLDRTGRGQTLS